MSIDMSSLDRNKYDQVTPLTPKKWQEAVTNAEAEIKESVSQPNLAHYLTKHEGEMPAWLRNSMLAILVIMAALAFYVSAGKQLLATAAVLNPVVQSQAVIDPRWADVSGYFYLGLGELGTIFFLAAASILPAAYVEVKSRKINFYGVAFRICGIITAMIAIVANISVAAWHIDQTTSVPIYDILATLVPPGTVLMIGVAVERILLMSLEHRAKAVKDYNAANDEYLLIQRDPKSHKSYQQTLNRCILKALYKLGNNEKLLSNDPSLRALAVWRELQDHAEVFDFSVFTNPLASTQVPAEQPTLSSSSNERLTDGQTPPNETQEIHQTEIQLSLLN
jgi:predicted membrane channel-forming protein YqfA (hemolysin III family)